MELASRIVSILLGAAVMALVLWPVTIPVGFSEVWWASRQAQSRSETPPPALPDPPRQAKPAAAPPEAVAPAPHAVPPSGAAPKPAQLARDKTEAERLAALKEKDAQKNATAAVAPKATTKLYHRITVRDGGTLQAGKVVIRLAAIAARDADATCKDEKGKSWRCGAAAKAALTRLIRARAVTCELPKGGEHNIFIARCSVAGTDLSAWLVRQGWAKPKDPKEPALAKAAEEAEAERIGLWRGAE
jgi:endonuclease YncB( thermonuclease family)